MALVRVLGYDHSPYRTNTSGMPEAIAQAQREGLARFLDDVDCRQLEWNDVDPTLRRTHVTR